MRAIGAHTLCALGADINRGEMLNKSLCRWGEPVTLEEKSREGERARERKREREKERERELLMVSRREDRPVKGEEE